MVDKPMIASFVLNDFDNQLDMLETLNEYFKKFNDVSDKNFILNQLVTKQKELIDELSDENRLLDKKLLQSEREKQHMRNVIKESMQNERTHLGYNTLKQLAERLEIL